MWEHADAILQIAADVATTLGIPIALWVFMREKGKERREREYGTYDALDEKYIEFQRLCLQYPHLDIFDSQELNKEHYTPEDERNELILFTILISLLERAHLMYTGQSRRMRAKQWDGWDEEIRRWCRRRRFIHAWGIVGDTYDADFKRYIEKYMSTAEK